MNLGKSDCFWGVAGRIDSARRIRVHPCPSVVSVWSIRLGVYGKGKTVTLRK